MLQIWFFLPIDHFFTAPLCTLSYYAQICSVVHEDDLCLDVCYEGFIFRLQLVASQEIEAIQLAAGASKVDTAALYRSVIRSTVVAPLHHLGVRALRSQFPSYTAAVKLMHSWAAQHYFSGRGLTIVFLFCGIALFC